MAEQIRTCLLLLENKWTEKKLELELDMQDREFFPEHAGKGSLLSS